MFNFILITISIVCVVYVTYTFVVKRQLRECEKVRYVYKPYVRTFQEEQDNPASALGLYRDLFFKSDPNTISASMPKDGTIQPFSWQGLPKSEVLREGESSNFVNAYFG